MGMSKWVYFENMDFNSFLAAVLTLTGSEPQLYLHIGGIFMIYVHIQYFNMPCQECLIDRSVYYNADFDGS